MLCHKKIRFTFRPVFFTWSLLIAIFSLIVYSPATTHAEFIFSFDPYLSYQTEYDDNIFLRRSAESDLIQTVSPGLVTSLTSPRLNVEVEYRPGFVYYRDNSDLDYTEHFFNFLGAYSVSPNLDFQLLDTYIRSNSIEYSDFADTDAQRDAVRNTLSRFRRNLVSPQMEYRFGSENVLRTSYRYTDYKTYDEIDDDSYKEHSLENELDYWFNTRNGLSVFTNLTQGNFSRETDLLYGFNVLPRLRHRLYRHLELYSEYGFGKADFERTKIYGNFDDGRRYLIFSENLEDYDLHQCRIGFVWEVASDLQIEGNIGYGWKNGKGDRDDQSILSLIEIEKTIGNLTANIRWETGFLEDFFASRDAGFSKFRRVSTTIAYVYQEKLECGVLGSFGNYDYSDDRDIFGAVIGESREDDRYRVRTFLAYHILQNYGLLSDLSLELEFNYLENDSNSITNDYLNRRYSGRIVATF